MASSELQISCASPPERVFYPDRRTFPVRERAPNFRSSLFTCLAEHDGKAPRAACHIDANLTLDQCVRNMGNRSKLPHRFPRAYVEAALASVASTAKDIDFSFVGGLARTPPMFDDQPNPRWWVQGFVHRYFTNASKFADTSVNVSTYKLDSPAPEWDHTLQVLSDGEMHRPRDIELGCGADQVGCDLSYLETMARTRFALAPAGDQRWSIRFFEAIMSSAIPIVETATDAGADAHERRLGYRFLLLSEAAALAEVGRLEYCPEWAAHNLRIFLANQAWPGADSTHPPVPSKAGCCRYDIGDGCAP